MKIVHSGFDALYVAFQGALRKSALAELHEAKEVARAEDRPVEYVFRGVRGQIMPNGTRKDSGYAFIFDTGPLGHVWKFKRSDDPEQWNIFVEVRALSLAQAGYWAVKDRLFGELKAFGAIVMNESINRVDYAVDVQTDEGFAISAQHIVCHSKATCSRHYEDPEVDGLHVIGARRVTSITVGRNPGRVVQIYDKRLEQRSRGKSAWFAIWGVDPDDCPPIWRVEIRSHKKDLGEWNLRTFDDLERGIEDVLTGALKAVRYVEDARISNISRAVLHPLWQLVTSQVQNKLWIYKDGRERKRIVECFRSDAEKQYSAQVRGLMVGLAVVHGFKASEDDAMADLAHDLTRSHLGSDKWADTRRRAEERFMFLDDVSDIEREAS